jgi:uridine phosphorylase
VVNFRGDRDWKRVLLVKTGMGSMNASLAVYELAAGLRGKPAPARRIIKIGTCSGLYPDELAGTVLVPCCALDDEGATKWNQKIADEAIWRRALIERLTKVPIEADKTLTKEWHDYLGAGCTHSGWWSLFVGDHSYPEGKSPRAAIWSIDNFHGFRLLAESLYPLMHEHAHECPDTVPVGVENECSSHFSACKRLELPIAAALVVSWSCNHVLHLATKGEDIRTGSVKDLVHDVETQLIVKAVHYLLGENYSG